MLPFLQFDPASFCLWLDLRTPAGFEPDAYHHLTSAMLLGQNDIDSLAQFVGRTSEKQKTFAALIFSAFIHEKRHFIDFSLSNFGAFKHRFFLEFYYNLPALIHNFESGGKKLLVPVHLHADPFYRKKYDLPSLTGNADRVINGYKQRLDMLRNDAQVQDFNGERISFGGDAQMEALAFLTQLEAAQKLFGFTNFSSWPESVRNNQRYFWILHLGVASGLMKVSDLGGAIDNKPVKLYNVTRIFPLLFAALQSRHWGQDKGKDDFHAAAWPAARLGLFAKALKEHPTELWHTSEVWNALSKISAKVFGRTLEEEMEGDMALQESYHGQVAQMFGSDSTVVKWTELLITRRKALYQYFKSNMDHFLDPSSSVKYLLKEVHPYPLLCSKTGTFREPSKDFCKVISYRDNFGAEKKEVHWWYVVGPKQNTKNIASTYGDADLHASIASDFAPVAKFLMHGNRQRIMLGAELELAHSLLTHKLNLSVIIDPVLGTHREKSEVESFFWLFGPDKKKMCDLCSNLVGVNESELLSKWIFKTRETNAQFLIQHFSDNPLGMIFILKDWSEWLLCHDCCNKLSIPLKDLRVGDQSSGFSFEGNGRQDKPKPVLARFMRRVSRSMRSIANRPKDYKKLLDEHGIDVTKDSFSDLEYLKEMLNRS